ncbi:rhodanese-like domain-containing protein [Streptomyces sp. NPDC005480]|uniref:rhodanese-like domain-containing protein n=1 Tax=Streptomyces sp. NPDC005480 TaxID=3154880 RepID=UPI0033AE55A9
MLQEGTAVPPDVREIPERRAAHAPGARHLPLSRLEAGARVPSTQDDACLALICRSGRRSQHVAGLLREQGSYAVDVVGGMQAWAVRGLPVQDAEVAAGTVI